jgi:trimeric autotransporter adhesin
MRLGLVLFAVGLVCVCGASAQQQGQTQAEALTTVPRLIQFSGVLKDSALRPVSGAASVTFAIYAEQEGGAALWNETQNVLADANGNYAIVLGAATSGGFPAELFGTGQARWLGVTVARASEMPRVLMASVPYALKAGDAETLGGLPAASYVTERELASRGLVAAPATTIVAATGATGSAPVSGGGASAGEAAGVGGEGGTSAQSVTQAAVTGTGTANYLPLWTSGSNLGVSKIYQANGGFVGINTNTPLLQLDVNGNSIFRGSFQMAPQGTATASAGQPSHSFQWQGSVFNSSSHAANNLAFGFRTVPDQNNVASPTAKLDLFYGPGGGTLTDTGLSIDSTGHIIFVPTQVVDVQGIAGKEVIAEDELTLEAGNPTAININGFAFLTLGGVNTQGSVSFGLGMDSLLNTIGGLNTAVGGYSLESDSSGNKNTAVGVKALTSDSTGGANTSVGEEALRDLTMGSSNVAVGVDTGNSNITGSNDTFIGAGAGPLPTNLQNATAIGANSTVNVSNAVVIGSVAGEGLGTTNVNVGIGTISPAYSLEVFDGNVGPGTSAILGATSIAGHNGVFGVSSATSGGSNGGFFTTASPGGAGIVATNSGGGLVASLQGDVQVTGRLTKGAGSFKIDDPIDPAGKYLSHSFVESPDMMNIYNGIVTLDAHGAAVVTMPEWFSALNRDFRYTLTAIGSPAPKLFIKEELHENCFRIAGGKKGQRVSWQITGIRQDAYANAHRIPTEEEKPANEQGHYLHPELFGAGADKAVGGSGAAGAAAASAAKTDAAADANVGAGKK